MEENGAFLWNVEKIVSKGDYLYAIVRDHPNKTKNNYVLLHRIVMENLLGRILNTNEVVHHKNENKKDNRGENLELLSKTEHAALHATVGNRMLTLCCPNCGIIFERRRNQTHLIKRGSFTSCSRRCRGQFFRKIQLRGVTQEMESAISVNILREFNSLDNTEGTYLQKTP
jgi:hypothetical protein